MTDEQHDVFCEFLRDYGMLVYAQIVCLWQKTYVPQGYPPVSATTVGRWIRRLGIAHSFSVSIRSAYSVQRRRKALNERSIKQDQARQERIARERDRRRARVAQLLAHSPNTPTSTCMLCNETLPLLDEFFGRLPHFFQRKGKRATALQGVVCKLCISDLRRERVRRRNAGESVEMIRAEAQRLWREILDRVAKAELEARKQERDEVFRRDPGVKRKQCLRCEEEWPLTDEWFEPNPSGRSYRHICWCCDRELDRHRVRRQRDGVSISPIIAERARLRLIAQGLGRNPDSGEQGQERRLA